ncbi:MAG: sigma-70 family RNA polymerase sigma factor [Anaerolineales bacterium]|nr:sigma-70 family RNA polymerase sigma factor [Anaerolineales bacterium]
MDTSNDTLSREEEAALVITAKNDPKAFGRLYQLNVKKVYNYIYYRTGNHHDAEDLTERVFFKALQHIGRYKEQGIPFSAWLYRIAHNIVANWHRDNRTGKIVALESISANSSAGDNPQRLAEKMESRNQLLEAIRTLPPDRQQLLILKFVEFYSNREIGEVLGRSEGAIKSLYHRTLISLRDILIDDE